MNPRIYDICMLTGYGLTVAGVYKVQGAGPALVVAGALLIALTAFGARR